MDCVDEETLIEFLAGRQDGPATARTREHVARCPACNAIATEVIRGAAAQVRAPLAHATGYELAAGVVLPGGYRLERPLGEGGMGIVWSATRISTGERVAIKLLKAFDARARRRFVREIAVTRSLDHPGLVRVVDVLDDVEAGCPALVMELLAGETLGDKLVREGRLAIPDAIDVAVSVAATLAYVHAHAVVHRDLKPGNVFLAPSIAAVKILDLGLAKIAESAEPVTRITRTGTAVGTPSYMAPEQLGGERDVDARADVWSLGAVLYECLTGRVPFAGITIAEILRAIAHDRPAAIDALRVGVPRGLADLVSALLSVDRARRPAVGVARAILLEARRELA